MLEAAVVGHADERRADQAAARSSCSSDRRAPPTPLPTELQAHVKATLAPYKYPRWIEFVAELPKTATGKIQRFKLRAEAPQG